MESRSLHVWRLKFIALSLLAMTAYGCAEDVASRERPTRTEPVTLVDPTDPNQASKVVPGAIQPPHATDSLPGNPGSGLTKPN
jgi:hypothetical protein